MRYSRFSVILIFVILVLFIPFIAMQFTEQVNWGLLDFIVAGVLLLGCALSIDFIFRKIKSLKYRIVLGLVVLIIFLLVWAELAVGIFGTPMAGQ